MISESSLVYDAVMRLMDQVEAVDKKVARLMSAAGVSTEDPDSAEVTG
jgi:hypothetical protein